MKDKELIPVFVRIEDGKTTCICKQGRRKCDRADCERDMVERDAYRDVEKMHKNIIRRICLFRVYPRTERKDDMPNNEWPRRTDAGNEPKKHLPVQAVQCIVCALLVLTVYGLSRAGSQVYARLRQQMEPYTAQDLCSEGVWTAAKQLAQAAIPAAEDPPAETQTVAAIDARAPVQTVASGGEDIRVLDALEDSSFEPVYISREAVMPVQGKVTSGFGYRVHPVTGRRSFHTGIDLAAPQGTPISAAFDGEVLETGCSEGRGNYILLRHGETLQTMYCHLSRIDVREGDAVAAGGTIGLVGSTGMSTGPHLHFEVRVDGVRCDPVYVLKDLVYA